MIIAIFKILLSIYLMWKVSSSFDLAANYLTRNLGEGIKGPTVNAVASSLPELLISSLFLFFYKDIEGFSAGFATIVGSSAFNIALIPAIAYYFAKRKNKNLLFTIDKNIVKQDGLFLLIYIILIGIGLYIGLNIYYSLLLIFIYVLYIMYVYKVRNITPLRQIPIDYNKKFENGMRFDFVSSVINLRLYNILGSKKLNNFNSILVIFISVLIISIACLMLVNVVEEVSNIFGINLFITAFFIAAISSSIPDTILSIKDAQHDKFNDSFSNTYGSNIFDICIGIGLPVFVYCLFYPPISVDKPIERLDIGKIGDYLLHGNLLLWSVIILFILTLLVTLIYRKGVVNSKNIVTIFIIYFLYILGLLIF